MSDRDLIGAMRGAVEAMRTLRAYDCGNDCVAGGHGHCRVDAAIATAEHALRASPPTADGERARRGG